MKKYFCLSIVVCFSLILMNLHLISSLECIYCPTYSTEDECNQMNMTQICINETKCGYARFIEKSEDLQPVYPNISLLAVTVKKGCMEPDYCTRIQQSSRGANVIFSECIFCVEDLCILKYPILCVECDEAVDEYCAIQSEPFVTCGPKEVCYGQRVQEAYYLKRGCMEPSRCLKRDFCQHCNKDLCGMVHLPSPFEQNQPAKERETHKDKNYNNSSSPSREYFVFNVILAILLICYNFYTT